MTKKPSADHQSQVDEEIRAYHDTGKPKRDNRVIVFISAFVIIFGLLGGFLITTNQNIDSGREDSLSDLDPALAAKLKPLLDRLDANPDDAAAMVNIGFSYFEVASFREAIRNFENARKIEPKSVNALVGLGMALQATGRRDEAGPVLDEALSYEPDNSFAKIRKAYFLAEVDKNDEALKLLEEVQATETDPDLKASVTQAIIDVKAGAAN